jgi:hypothetical protein
MDLESGNKACALLTGHIGSIHIVVNEYIHRASGKHGKQTGEELDLGSLPWCKFPLRSFSKCL